MFSFETGTRNPRWYGACFNSSMTSAPTNDASHSEPASPAREAEMEALRNDAREAKETAQGLERTLAKKSNEWAGLRMVFEKTMNDFVELEQSERAAFEALEQVTAERDKLQRDVDALTAALAASEGVAAILRSRELHICRLTIALDKLKAEIEILRPASAGGGTSGAIAMRFGDDAPEPSVSFSS
jgi:septal ring factor EnvC (AmiA/AmiB activator)